MFACLLALCAMTIQMTNACYNVAECPFGRFKCTRGIFRFPKNPEQVPKNPELEPKNPDQDPKNPEQDPKNTEEFLLTNTNGSSGNTISFEAEVSLKRLTFTSFTLGNGEGPGCKVDTFTPEGEDGDMAFVRLTTGIIGGGQGDCGIEETNGGLLTISVWVSGTILGKEFELHFSFRGHNFGGPDRTYLAEIDDPNGVVECFCENGGKCVRDEHKATVYCKCPKPYNGRFCTEHLARIPCRNPAKGINGERIFCGRGPNRQDCPLGYECKISPTDRWAVCCPTKGRYLDKQCCHGNSGCGCDCMSNATAGCDMVITRTSNTTYDCKCFWRDGTKGQACKRACNGDAISEDCECDGCKCTCSRPRKAKPEE